MVVVVMIGVLVTLAIPSIATQMHDRRMNQAAHEIALLYRQARSIAMGRGAAVMVRFDAKAESRGAVEVREAKNDQPSQSCVGLPATSCGNTDWNAGSAQNHLIAAFEPAKWGVYSNVQLKFKTSADPSGANAIDICFSPLGRPYWRRAHTGAFIPMTEVPQVDVSPFDGLGLTRTVLVLPTGASRLAL